LRRWSRERRLEPSREGLVEQTILLVLGRDLEERIDLGLHRALAEDVRAERVDRSDPRRLELLERLVEPIELGGAAVRRSRAVDDALVSRALDLGAQAKLHLARGLLGEGHGDEVAAAARERRAARSEEGEDAFDERRRLAGPGRSLDDERRAEV